MASKDINLKYTKFYARQASNKVYPTEFIVRTLLANYPKLSYKKPEKGDSILDIAFGDGRNTAFLCDLGLDVHGIEITREIVEQTRVRLAEIGYKPTLRVGRNNNIPYNDNSFDYIIACHCCYYCDEGDTLIDNLKEYQRILKPDGILIASVADKQSYIFRSSESLLDGTSRIQSDPYSNRDGYRLQGFSSEKEIEDYFFKYYNNFSFGRAQNNYYGIDEQLFWVVCKNKKRG